MTGALFETPALHRPNLAALPERPLEPERLREQVSRLHQVGASLVAAWQAHPLYGQGLGEERWSNPMVRLEIHHACGPRHGAGVSVSFVRLSAAAGELADIARRLKTLPAWHFQIMPVLPTDPVFGLAPQNPKVYGDWFLRIPRFWDFPNRAGLNFMARRRFVRRFPKLRKLLAKARHHARCHANQPPEARERLAAAGIGRLPGKKSRFVEAVSRSLADRQQLAAYGLTADDLWAVATNRLTPDQVDRLGESSQPALFA